MLQNSTVRDFVTSALVTDAKYDVRSRSCPAIPPTGRRRSLDAMGAATCIQLAVPDIELIPAPRAAAGVRLVRYRCDRSHRPTSLINIVKSSASYSTAQIRHSTHDLQSFSGDNLLRTPPGRWKILVVDEHSSASLTPSSSSSISWRRTSRVRTSSAAPPRWLNIVAFMLSVAFCPSYNCSLARTVFMSPRHAMMSSHATDGMHAVNESIPSHSSRRCTSCRPRRTWTALFATSRTGTSSVLLPTLFFLDGTYSLVCQLRGRPGFPRPGCVLSLLYDAIPDAIPWLVTHLAFD